MNLKTKKTENAEKSGDAALIATVAVKARGCVLFPKKVEEARKLLKKVKSVPW
jgi:hypothetical protein